MKKFLLTLMAAAGLTASASAQLANGSVFPNLITTDIKGNPINVYNILASGKTVFIDVSATWCGPCWSYHLTGALDNIWKKHGPLGAPGVDPTTTNDAYVIFVQGETGSGMAELTYNWGGGAGAGRAQNTTFNHTTFTQGDWTAGVDHPIVDDSTAQATMNSLWKIAYFPTVYMVCQDRLVYELTQPSESAAYAALLAGCPTYSVSATVDAKATAYTGNGSFNCNATPTISFQNYSTATLTAATINVIDGAGTTVHTEPWTGSLAPYAVANVTLSSFPGTTFSGYKYSVVAAGDTYPANNTSQDSVFKVYGASNASSLPFAEDFEASTNFYKYYLPDAKGYTIVSSSLSDPASTTGGSKDIIGKSGSKTVAVWFDNYDATNASPANTSYPTSFLFGNYNITANTNLTFDISYSAKNAAATSSDKLDLMVSTDCGTTWTSAWSASGTALATTTATTSKWFIPSASTDWKSQKANLNAYKNSNLMIKFQSTTSPASAGGMLLYLDNINFVSAVSVNEVVVNNDITVFPNPATDHATVNLTLNSAATVTVQLIDVLGHVINTVNEQLTAGNQNIALSTASLASGLYSVKISTEGFTTVKPLSIVK